MGFLSFSMGLVPEIYGLRHWLVNTERAYTPVTGKVADIAALPPKTG
jgi:hypothetical protein